MRVLLVEDDDGVGDALTEALAARGHVPTRVRRGADALSRHHEADLVLLDLGLPDTDGLEVLRMLRKVADVPVLVLTARGDERSVVRGLRLGADDYVVKPVRLAELLARMDTITHRAAARSSTPHTSVVRVSDVEIDMSARRVRTGDQEISLTTKEFELLAVLARRRGTAVSRQQLMDEVWGDAYLAISRSLDVHMTQLRAKLKRPGLLTTIRGFGYRLGE
ncbi:response regulator transcription factor [Kibdelosporangium aridum]|uniref:DNA-binding response regulator, OmpR family, contains REC and winged-helix (WHTH) domain n=1 Tax=Kibdelosporangium aridum TaxID=2030 RepID=A0A1W2AIW2_KIBAR|nr:response regulator transcription factor [Kibdelosporangium aridum]SMC60500.1 DNA-binding response regulator, OmpR family, contains REC and winged-helix (wHTH) domain [Kibdelosporangium aridum]